MLILHIQQGQVLLSLCCGFSLPDIFLIKANNKSRLKNVYLARFVHKFHVRSEVVCRLLKQPQSLVNRIFGVGGEDLVDDIEV